MSPFATIIQGGPKEVALQTHYKFCQILTDFQFFFTERFLRKFAANSLLKIPTHLANVATLPCETLMSENKRLTINYKVV